LISAHRRVLARAKQEAIAQGLKNVAALLRQPEQKTKPTLPQTPLSAPSPYALLLDPILKTVPK